MVPKRLETTAKAITKITKHRLIPNKPTKEVKWNHKKYSNNSKEGRKRGKENKEQMGQTENKQQ